MSTSLIGTRRALLGGVARLRYFLRATFDAGDQGYADGQVLDTVVEGVQAGQLTVVEVDGTLAVVSNKCAFTAQGTPTYGDLGFYSQAITKALGIALISTINLDAIDKQTIGPGWQPDISLTNYLFHMYWRNTGPGDLAIESDSGALNVASYSASTDYQTALVLGGYHSNRVPWRNGQAAASYLYGAAHYIKGGAWTNWTLLWRNMLDNTGTLYAMLSLYDQAGTIDDFRVPDRDLSAVLQPNNLSTFTAPNGTSLDAITPEVGGAWTEDVGTFDIQGNRAEIITIVGKALATVGAGISDGIVDVTVHREAADAGVQGLSFRQSDTANYWRLVASLATNLFLIQDLQGAGPTTRASAAVALVHNTDYDLRLIMDGQQVDGFLDGGNKISFAVAAFNETVTNHGLYGDTAGNVMQFDNFAVFQRTSPVYEAKLEAC